MKKVILTLIAAFALTVASLVGAANNVYYQTFGSGSLSGISIPFQPVDYDTKGASFILMDVLLDTNGVTTTRPIDFLSIPYVQRTDTTGGADFAIGSFELSCYDVSDSAAVLDTVDVVALFYKSQYAGDGINPVGGSGGKNDVWVIIDSLPINAPSAAQAIVDTGKVITVANERDRYIRATITNRQTVLKDKPRCRLYWTKKRIIH